MKNCPVFIVAFLYSLLPSTLAETETGSFFGNSDAHIPLVDSSNHTQLSLRLKTARADSVILVAAGTSCYLLLFLERGCVKARINFGDGESEVSSQPHQRLDDLLWHEVRLERSWNNITLILDGHYSSRITLRGRISSLNIDYGVFIGGLGEFSDIFFGLLDNYMGCLHRVRFNGINLLAGARKASTSHNVEWRCSRQFGADQNSTISFLDVGAYAMFPSRLSSSGGTISLKIRTRTIDGLIFYSHGEPPDYMRVFLEQGRVKLVLTSGVKILSLSSKINVSDGSWHRVVVTINLSFLELRVDQTLTSLIPKGVSEFSALNSNFYLGAAQKSASRSANSSKERNVDSIVGCIRELYISNQLSGLSNILESQKVDVGCILDKKCSSLDCSPSDLCSESDFIRENCRCVGIECSSFAGDGRNNVFSDPSRLSISQMLALSPVQVLEGDHATLTFENVQLVLDIEKYGVQETGVFFHIVEPPTHGRITADIWRRPDESIFTYEHLLRGYIHYLHSGSETKDDSIVLEVKLVAGTGFKLPSFLEKQHKFLLPVVITPTNDIPEIRSIPSSHILRVARGVPRLFDSDIFQAIDDDTLPDHLVYTLLSYQPTNGRIENIKKPGSFLRTFTQAQIDKGVIALVHDGSGQGELSLHVSDGISVSEPVHIKISTFELKAIPVNNTGLKIFHQESAVISRHNLSFTTNAIHSRIDIKYMIIKQPSNGKVQKLRGNGSWISTNHFSMTNVIGGLVRYQHDRGYPEYDQFSFRMSLNKMIQRRVYQFRINFQIISVNLKIKNDLVLNQTYQKSLSNDNLLIEAFPIEGVRNVSYEIKRTPRFGDLFRLEGQPARHSLLISGDSFKQRDISEGKVLYRIHQKSFTSFIDEFSFNLKYPGSPEETHELKVLHVPAKLVGNTIFNEIYLGEGDTIVIPSSTMQSNTASLDMFFNISRKPEFGVLQVLDESMTSPVRDNADYLTSSEIENGRVQYVHDGSETTVDEFQFVAHYPYGTFSTLTDEHSRVNYRGTVRIHIQLVNDNKPERIADRLLYVVHKGRKVVERSVLAYIDQDLHTESTDLVYTRRAIANGQLYKHPNYRSPIYKFTQADIDSDLIVFEHRGPGDFSDVLFWITDGEHYTTGVLRIEASEPFVRVNTSTKFMLLIVPRNNVVTFDSTHIFPETNLEVSDGSVLFRVEDQWRQGVITVRGRESRQFSYQDILDSSVQYEIKDRTTSTKRLDFIMSVGKLKSNGSLIFRILPETYWEPLTIMNNKTAIVKSRGITTISKMNLLIMHPNIPTDEIHYTITRPPKYGILLVNAPNFIPKSSFFTQASINDDNLTYVQSIPNITNDNFEFSVSNSIVTINNLLFHIELVPVHVLLTTTNVSVTEGGSLALPPHCLQVSSSYHRQQLRYFSVESAPQQGRLVGAGNKKNALNRFTADDLATGDVLYIHNGDESEVDCLTIVAHTVSEQSAAGKLCLHVLGVNDHPPSLAVKQSVEVFTAGKVAINENILEITDIDLPSTDLTVHVTSSPCGKMEVTSAVTSRNESVVQFSQSQLRAGVVYFHHQVLPPDETSQRTSGSKSNSERVNSDCFIYMYASDGKFRTEVQQLKVRVRRLTLQMANNGVIEVFPYMLQPITHHHLLALTNDQLTRRTIEYHLIKGPQLGRLIRMNSDGTSTNVHQFTQEEINRGSIYYNQTKKLAAPRESDAFIVRVTSPTALPLSPVTVQLVISLKAMSSGAIYRSEVNALDIRLNVREGGRSSISAINFNMDVVMAVINQRFASSGSKNVGGGFVGVNVAVTSLPKHGRLELTDRGSRSNLVGVKISYSDITAGRLRYIHDDSETIKDQFSYSLHPVSSKGSSEFLYNGTLEVVVEPINDQRPTLGRKTLRLDVVQKQTAVITSATLNATDVDTLAENIVYSVIQRPRLGRLVVIREREARIPSIDALVNFTQADINSRKLKYVHGGSLGRDKMRFVVSDGVHTTSPRQMTMNIIPLSLNIIKNSPVMITQGNNRVTLKSDYFSANTNGQSRTVSFELIKQPLYGRLFINSTMISFFTQVDIAKENVYYLQMDMEHGVDFFRANVFNEYNSIRNVTFEIEVVPQMSVKEMHIVQGSTSLLSLDTLDASPLAFATESNPTYQVIKSFKHGYLVQKRKKDRTQRDIQLKNVTMFTHQDLLQRNIHFVCSEIKLDGEEIVTDTMEFVLNADNVQPARGTLRIQIVSNNSVLMKKSKEPGANSVLDREHTNVFFRFVRREYVLIAGSILGVLVSLILLMFAARCIGNSRYRQRQNKIQTNQSYGTAIGQADVRKIYDLQPLKEQPNVNQEVDYLNTTLPSPPSSPAVLGTFPRTGLLTSSRTNFDSGINDLLLSVNEGCNSSILPRHCVYTQHTSTANMPASTVTLRRPWPSQTLRKGTEPPTERITSNRIATLPHCTVTPLFVTESSNSPPLLSAVPDSVAETCHELGESLRDLRFHHHLGESQFCQSSVERPDSDTSLSVGSNVVLRKNQYWV